MDFEFAYRGHSSAQTRGDRTALSFSPDLKREPTYFSGELAGGVDFREAISALHDVVVSDLRWKPKDRDAYLAWAAEQEQRELVDLGVQAGRVRDEILAADAELTDVNKAINARLRPFYTARQRYFDYLWRKDRDAWIVLDPVISVHPDELFFECFSRDESTYARLGVDYEHFRSVGDHACGTTNIDYSSALYNEFQKIRTYRRTRLDVDPSGFGVATSGEDDYREEKIDLPDSWVRGFLQVSSAMTMPAVRVELHPSDVWSFCFVLRRNKERRGPRSMRYVLRPGEPVRVVFEPWGTEVVCSRSIYEGPEATEIRVWGRRRLLVLERLIPVAKRFTVHLLGRGMPSFYVADLEGMSFTLGLSGWTANDWSRMGAFDLMAPRLQVDSVTQRRVFESLKESWVADATALAARLGLDQAVVLGALQAYTQAGRAIFDLHRGLWRARELSREPLPMDRLRFASPREASARDLVHQRRVRVTGARPDGRGGVRLSGVVRDEGRDLEPALTIDPDERMLDGRCTCRFFFQNKLHKGPCEHLLALRMQHDG